MNIGSSPEQHEQFEQKRLAGELYHEIADIISELSHSEQSNVLRIKEEGQLSQFGDLILQELNKDGTILTSISEDEVLGRKVSIADTVADPVEVFTLYDFNKTGASITPSLMPEIDTTTSYGLISFEKDGDDASCSGVLWFTSDQRIVVESVIKIPPDELGGTAKALEYAAGVGLATLWRRQLENLPESELMNPNTEVAGELDNEMGVELKNRLLQFVDHSDEEA